MQSAIAASHFGISGEMDAYNIAYNITTFIFSFFAAAITTIIIPSLVKGYYRSVNTFITVLIIILLICLGSLLTFRNSIVSLIGGQELYHINLASDLLIILLIGGFFRALTGFTNAIYQVNNKYIFPKFSQLTSVTIAIIIIVFSNNLTIFYFTAAISLGFIMDFIFQCFMIKKSIYTYIPNFRINDKEFRKMFKSILPIFISTAFFQISILIDTILASRLGEGNVSILSYSNQIVAMVNSLVLVNLIAFMYPQMAKLMKKDKVISQSNLQKNVLLSTLIMLYIVLVYILLGRQAITIFFERGSFNSNATDTVYFLSVLYFLSLPFSAVRDLIYRYFYGDNDTVTPLKNSLLVTLVKIFFSIVLCAVMGIKGIVFGTIIASVASVVMITHRFNKKYTLTFNLKYTLIEVLKISISGLFALTISMGLDYFITDMNLFLKVFVLLLISTLLYGGFCYIFRVNIFKESISNLLNLEGK
ncbi:murein biosynthesis integral membrane protein MurJ [Metabacillus sp. 84]|uniref:murein biosynthesis integral membrane protein MurJ n=1 Tax=Metabacillus sp. 84 TaxID=3404705 RepID=UPI003CFA6D54